MADPSIEYGPPLEGEIFWPRPGGDGAFAAQRTLTHMHQGIDIKPLSCRGSGGSRDCGVGTPWLAVADGIIRMASNVRMAGMGGYGRVAVLEHKDRETGRYVWMLYAHGLEVTAVQGSHVSRGDVIGKQGQSEFSAHPNRPEGTMGSHLHFETALHPYPQRGPETPVRFDPYILLRDVPGVPQVPIPTWWRTPSRNLANYAARPIVAYNVPAPVNGLDVADRKPLPSPRQTPGRGMGAGTLIVVGVAVATAAVVLARR